MLRSSRLRRNRPVAHATAMAPVLTPPTAGQIAGMPAKARASRPSETPSPASW
jgi:hypothetical protein